MHAAFAATAKATAVVANVSTTVFSIAQLLLVILLFLACVSMVHALRMLLIALILPLVALKWVQLQDDVLPLVCVSKMFRIRQHVPRYLVPLALKDALMGHALLPARHATVPTAVLRP